MLPLKTWAVGGLSRNYLSIAVMNLNAEQYLTLLWHGPGQSLQLPWTRAVLGGPYYIYLHATLLEPPMDRPVLLSVKDSELMKRGSNIHKPLMV